MAYYVPPSKKVGGHVPRVPHQIAPMCRKSENAIKNYFITTTHMP